MSKKVGFLILLGTLGFVFANGSNNAFAGDNTADNVTLSVEVSCSMTKTLNSEHTKEVALGVYENNIGESTFKTYCNDAGGYAVYAVGYSDNTFGNNTLVPENIPAANSIATGTATSGNTSNWAMKLSAVSGTYAPTIATGFNDYHAVPDDYTKVVSLTSNTDFSIGSSFKTTYAAYVAQNQIADTYNGVVKYTLVYPANAIEPSQYPDIQNLDATLCTTTPSQARDIRDGHVYTIQRLEDGKCWMIENLDLGRTDLTTDLTSVNTNLSTTVTAATFNSWKKTTGSQTYDAGEFIPLTTSNASDGLDTDSTSDTAYGTLYNFYAASAGTVSGTNNTSNTTYDICPAGWRLPTGGSSGEFRTLYTKYGSNATFRASIENSGAAFALAGSFSNSNPVNQGSRGSYWSSTRYNNSNEYILFLNTSVTAASDDSYRSYGYSIRCVMKELFMQDVSSWGSSVQAGEEIVAKDIRDDKSYTVARLADGNLWMTQNLDFDIDSTKTYTPANTDIPANWTPSASTYQSEDTTWNSEFYSPESYDPGELYYNLENIDYSINGEGDPPELFVDTGDYHSHLGNYYNWAAAIATNDSTSYVGSGNLVDRSICPAGWTLPRPGYGDDSFYGLATAYHTTWGQYGAILSGDLNLWEAPVYFLQYGFWYGEFSNVGGDGSFWTSVSGSNDTSYALSLSIGPWGNYIYPAEWQVYLIYGFSVRCIARPVTSTVTFTAP